VHGRGRLVEHDRPRPVQAVDDPMHAGLVAGDGMGGEHDDVVVVTSKVLSKCEGRIVPAPQDPEEQEALSKRLGNKTVLVENTSYSQGHQTRSWQTEQMPLMTPDQVALIPTEPRFKKRGGEPAVDADGALIVDEPAYQLIWAPNCPAIYARKSQWFTNGRIKKLIASIPSVIPKPLNASQALADAYAIQEHIRTTPHRPETETRRKARVAESIATRRLDPDGGGGPELVLIHILRRRRTTLSITWWSPYASKQNVRGATR